MSLVIKLRSVAVKKLRSMCGGSTPGREMKRAQILLRLHDGYSVDEAAEAIGCGSATVKRVRRRFLDGGLERAIKDAPRPGRAKKLTDRQERELIALACSAPPGDSSRWTIRLLVKHTGHGFGIVQRILANDGIKPWREKNVVRS